VKRLIVSGAGHRPCIDPDLTVLMIIGVALALASQLPTHLAGPAPGGGSESLAARYRAPECKRRKTTSPARGSSSEIFTRLAMEIWAGGRVLQNGNVRAWPRVLAAGRAAEPTAIMAAGPGLGLALRAGRKGSGQGPWSGWAREPSRLCRSGESYDFTKSYGGAPDIAHPRVSISGAQSGRQHIVWAMRGCR